YGGAIITTSELRERMFRHSRMFVGSTPMPLPLVAAAIQSVKILERDQRFRHRLHANADILKNGFRSLIDDTPGPMIGIQPSSAVKSSKLQKALLSAGIYPPLIRYPGGPESGYFRFAISSEHSNKQLSALLKVLKMELGTRA